MKKHCYENTTFCMLRSGAALGVDRVGMNTPGNFADLVLLDKNPLEDIRNTQTIWRVIRGGHLYDPNTFLEQ